MISKQEKKKENSKGTMDSMARVYALASPRYLTVHVRLKDKKKGEERQKKEKKKKEESRKAGVIRAGYPIPIAAPTDFPPSQMQIMLCT